MNGEDTRVNLCDKCRYRYPDCPAKFDDVEFGDGKGRDNIFKCKYYKSDY